MRKYYLVFKNTLNEYFIFRFNFILWRVRVVFQLLTLYFFWKTVFLSQDSIFGYDRPEMVAYIFVSLFLSSFVFATGTQGVGQEINEGKLTDYLIRPFSYFKYYLAKDVADKAFNIFFSVFEIIGLLYILKPGIFLQTDFVWLGLFVLSVFLATGIYFILSFIIGSVAFWTNEVWGIRFIFMILVMFLSGGMFPLDILPESIYRVISLLPFSYLTFFPIKIYLGSLEIGEVVRGLGVMIGWFFVLRVVLSVVWKKGLASYSAEGR